MRTGLRFGFALIAMGLLSIAQWIVWPEVEIKEKGYYMASTARWFVYGLLMAWAMRNAEAGEGEGS